MQITVSFLSWIFGHLQTLNCTETFAKKIYIYIWLFSRPVKWDDNNQDYPQVEAEDNFWGSPNPAYVAGRIWERRDDDNLIGVRYDPFYAKNTSVLQGNMKSFLSQVVWRGDVTSFWRNCTPALCSWIITLLRCTISGKCPPGFRLYSKVNSCYMYMGAVLPYYEAERQCSVSFSTKCFADPKQIPVSSLIMTDEWEA